MIEFKTCENIKDYFQKNNLKNIILLSQARSGSTFATYNLSKFLNFTEKNIYPEEYFFNRHFSYLRHFTKKHINFFLNINEFIFKRIHLNRSDTLFIYLYREPIDIMQSYEKAKKKGYYKGWIEFYDRYKTFFPDIDQNLDTANFNHQIWLKQRNSFTHNITLHYDLLKDLPGFITQRENFTDLKQIDSNKIISVDLKNKINFNFIKKFYFFLRRKLESRKRIIDNY